MMISVDWLVIRSCCAAGWLVNKEFKMTEAELAAMSEEEILALVMSSLDYRIYDKNNEELKLIDEMTALRNKKQRRKENAQQKKERQGKKIPAKKILANQAKQPL